MNVETPTGNRSVEIGGFNVGEFVTVWEIKKRLVAGNPGPDRTRATSKDHSLLNQISFRTGRIELLLTGVRAGVEIVPWWDEVCILRLHLVGEV